MKVKEIMSQPVITVTEDTTLKEIAGVMLDNGIGCVPVLDGHGKIVGIITHTDFTAKEKGMPFSVFRAPQLLGRWLKEGAEEIYEAAQTMTAKDIMTKNPVTLVEDDLVKTLLEKLMRHKITHIPIVRDGIPIGIVARQDLLKMMTGIVVKQEEGA